MIPPRAQTPGDPRRLGDGTLQIDGSPVAEDLTIWSGIATGFAHEAAAFAIGEMKCEIRRCRAYAA